MAIAPYDPAALGPSQAAAIDQMAYQNQIQSSQNRSDMVTQQGRLTEQYKDVLQPQLESTLGATGQFYSTSARKAEGQAGLGYQNQMADISTAFHRSQMDMKRQEVFAAMGLIL